MAVVALLILISLIIIVTLEQLEVSKLYGISDMMTHINLLFHFGDCPVLCLRLVSLVLSLFYNALQSMGTAHLHAQHITENWGLVALQSRKRLATAAIILRFGGLQSSGKQSVYLKKEPAQ